MGNITPQPVVDYLAGLRRDPHERLAEIDREGRGEGLPLVYPDTGALLHTLARTCGAKRILEIGTAIGYSTLWMATALPADGALITMEYDAARAARARDHFAAAGYADHISVIVGDATRFLHKVSGPFDLIFQDSDKKLYEPMLDRLIELLRPGGLLVADNVLWNGEVIPGFVANKKYGEADTAAIVSFSQRVANDSRLYTSFLQVGDGVSVSIKL
jgi:predicted O-methyltransferase YrrM